MKLLSFQILSLAAVILFAYLGLILLLAPEFHMETLGYVASEGGALMARRSAPAFLGVAVILWMFRNTYAFEVRRKVALGASTMFLLIAVVGLADFFADRAGPAIFKAVVVEALFGLAFLPYTGRATYEELAEDEDDTNSSDPEA